MKWYENFLKRIKDLQFLVEVKEIVVDDADFNVIYHELFEKDNSIPTIEGKQDRTFNKRPMIIFGVTILTEKMRKDQIIRDLPLDSEQKFGIMRP